jgi:hypothetical protein
MKKYVKMLLLAAAFQSLTVNAEVLLKNNSELLGKWTLYAEAAKIDGEKKAVKVEWAFENDGTLLTTSTDSVGRTKEMKIAIKYFVENGEIKKQTTPGREKYESCKVIEKEGSNMVLKCTYLYFFLTKI